MKEEGTHILERWRLPQLWRSPPALFQYHLRPQQSQQLRQPFHPLSHQRRRKRWAPYLPSLSIILTRRFRSPALKLIASFCPRQFYHPSILPRIPVKTSMTFPVWVVVLLSVCTWHLLVDGGWLRAHPLPADKGSFGNFEALAQENNQIIKHILESNSSVSPADDQIMTKLRDFYGSCLNEAKLNEIGIAPLLHIVKTVKSLYNGTETSISNAAPEEDTKVKGLTAAISFLHSRGIFYYTWVEIILQSL